MSDFQERNLPPTTKRLQDAKQQGKIPRSHELTMALMIITSAAIIYIFAHSLLLTLQNCLLSVQHSKQIDIATFMHQLCSSFVRVLIPICLIYLLIIFGSSSLAGGFSWLPNLLTPKSARISPINGMRRVFSINSAIEAIKTLCKFVLLGCTCIMILSLSVHRLNILEQQNITTGLSNFLAIIRHSMFWLFGCLVLFTLLDIPYQYWLWKRSCRMTQAELKEEQEQNGSTRQRAVGG